MFSDSKHKSHKPKKPKQTEFDKIVAEIFDGGVRFIGFIIQELFLSIRYGTFPLYFHVNMDSSHFCLL